MLADSCKQREQVSATESSLALFRGTRGQHIPEEIAVDATDSPHVADFCPQADDLDAHVGALLDHDVGVVGELRRRRAGVVLDLVGHQLRRVR